MSYEDDVRILLNELWMCGSGSKAHLAKLESRNTPGKYYSYCGKWVDRDAGDAPHCLLCEQRKALSLP